VIQREVRLSSSILKVGSGVLTESQRGTKRGRGTRKGSGFGGREDPEAYYFVTVPAKDRAGQRPPGTHQPSCSQYSPMVIKALCATTLPLLIQRNTYCPKGSDPLVGKVSVPSASDPIFVCPPVTHCQST
jgi:hypothetical protein